MCVALGAYNIQQENKLITEMFVWKMVFGVEHQYILKSFYLQPVVPMSKHLDLHDELKRALSSLALGSSPPLGGAPLRVLRPASLRQLQQEDRWSASSRLVGLSPVRVKLRLSARRVDEARKKRTPERTKSQAGGEVPSLSLGWYRRRGRTFRQT